MSGLFSDHSTSNVATNNQQNSTSVGNIFGDQRFQTAYDTLSNIFNPAAVANSGAINPLQTAAGEAQSGVAGSVLPAQAAATGIAQGGIDPKAIETYRNQYAHDVVDPTVKTFFDARDRAFSGINGDAAAQGALGNNTNLAQTKAVWDANNMDSLRRDVAQLESQGYQSGATTAAQSAGTQVSAAGTAGQLAGAQTGANQVASNIGEQQRLAALTPFELAGTGIKDQAIPSLAAGTSSEATGSGTSNTATSATPSPASIFGGIAGSLLLADGGAVPEPGYAFGGYEGGDQTFGALDGGSPFGGPGSPYGEDQWGAHSSGWLEPGPGEGADPWAATVHKEDDNSATKQAIAQYMRGLGQKKPQQAPGKDTSQMDRQQHDLTAMMQRGENQIGGIGSYARADGGSVPLHDKVKAAYQVFDELRKNGGGVKGEQGLEGGGTPLPPPTVTEPDAGPPPSQTWGSLPYWQRDIQDSPFAKFPQHEEMPSGPPPAAAPPPPPRAAAPPPPPPPPPTRAPPADNGGWGNRWATGGIFDNQPMTGRQKLATMLLSIKSPRFNAPFEDAGNKMTKFAELQGQQAERDLRRDEMLGKINDANGVSQPTLAGARNPAQIEALEAQGSNEQIRRQGIDAANKQYEKQLDLIMKQQIIDEDGHTPAKQQFYQGQREAARAQLQAQIFRYNSMGTGAGGGKQIAPTAPRVRTFDDLFTGRP